MREFLAGIGAAFISLFGMGSAEPAQPVVYRTNQPAATIVAQADSTDSPLTTPASTSTVVNQFITQPVIEREVLAADAITHAELDAALAGLRVDLLAAIQGSLPSVYTIASAAPVAHVSTQVFAHSQRIDQLGNVTITNATVSGVTGLTDADIPDTITASNYLPLSGGTVTGDFTLTGNFTLTGTQTQSGALSIPYLTATSTTQASSFLQASSSRFSVFDKAYFGGTATSTFDSLGSLALVGSLAISTTTATSTISTGGFTVGTSQFVVQQTSGSVGIGTTSPSAPFAVAGASVSGAASPTLAYLAQTWNTTGVPSAIKADITDTATGACSNNNRGGCPTLIDVGFTTSGGFFNVGRGTGGNPYAFIAGSVGAANGPGYFAGIAGDTESRAVVGVNLSGQGELSFGSGSASRA